MMRATDPIPHPSDNVLLTYAAPSRARLYISRITKASPGKDVLVYLAVPGSRKVVKHLALKTFQRVFRYDEDALLGGAWVAVPAEQP